MRKQMKKKQQIEMINFSSNNPGPYKTAKMYRKALANKPKSLGV